MKPKCLSGRSLLTASPSASSLEPPTSNSTVHHPAPTGLGSDPHRQPNELSSTTPTFDDGADDLEQDVDLLLQSLDEDALLNQEYSRYACSNVSLILVNLFVV